MMKTRYIINLLFICLALVCISVEVAYDIEVVGIEETKEADSESETFEFDTIEKEKKNVDDSFILAFSINYNKKTHLFNYQKLTDLSYLAEPTIPPEFAI